MIKALTSGFRSLQSHWRLIFIFWLVNIIIAKLSLIPLFRILDAFFGKRLPMEAADSTLSVSHWVDLTFATVDPRGIGFGGFKIWMVVAFFVALFLSAGAFSTLSEDRYESRRFWGDSGAWFLPYLRLTLWSILPLIVLLLPAGVPLLVKKFMGDDIPQDVLVSIALWVVALGAIGVFLWRMVFDYARAWAVSRNLRATRRAVYRATVFVFKKMPVAFSFALVVALLHFGAIYLSHRLTGWANASWPENGVIGIIFGQLSLLVVIAFRLVRYRGVLAILNHYDGEPSPALAELEKPTDSAGSALGGSTDALSDSNDPAPEPVSSFDEEEPQQPVADPSAEKEPVDTSIPPDEETDRPSEAKSDSTTEKIKSGDEDSDLATYLDNLGKE